MVQLVLRCSEDTTCHCCVEKAGESFCKTKELEELRALPEAQLSGWRRKPAWMQQCRLLSPQASRSHSLHLHFLSMCPCRISSGFPSQAVRKQSSWKQGHEKQRSGGSDLMLEGI